MGTGSSVQPKHGVLANPRVQYAAVQSKKKKKDYQIDAPVLIDLNHGSIRYRYMDGHPGESSSKMQEQPFEGDAAQKKGHYFYQPRLNDFSSKASKDREDEHKFLYVIKGPANANQKKVFYVYGRGLDAKDGNRTRPMATKAMGHDPSWPQRQNPNDVYYNLTFTKRVPAEDPIPGIPNIYEMQFALNKTDTVSELKTKIALTIIKSPVNVHVCYHQNTLNTGKVIVELMSLEETPEMFGVNMTLMDH